MNVRPTEKQWQVFEEQIGQVNFIGTEVTVIIEEITPEMHMKYRRVRRRIANYRSKSKCAFLKKVTKRQEAIQYYENLYKLTGDKNILHTLMKLKHEKENQGGDNDISDDGQFDVYL